MKIGFMGAPEFAVETLDLMLKNGFNVPIVYTQQPRKKGRGGKTIATPVHIFAIENNIEVATPTKFLAEDIDELKSFNLDFIVVVAYGLILPQEVLDTPKFCCLNGHPSILPRWRGAAPINRTIEAGDKKTGVCIIKMDAGLDTGDILAKEELDIAENTCCLKLHNNLKYLTAKKIVETINCLINGNEKLEKQSELGITYANKLLKSESNINWENTTKSIQNKVLAFVGFPTTTTIIKNEKIKIIETKIVNNHNDYNQWINYKAGQVISICPLVIKTADGAIEIIKLQRPNKKPNSARDFLNGFSLSIGDTFE